MAQGVLQQTSWPTRCKTNSGLRSLQHNVAEGVLQQNVAKGVDPKRQSAETPAAYENRFHSASIEFCSIRCEICSDRLREFCWIVFWNPF